MTSYRLLNDVLTPVRAKQSLSKDVYAFWPDTPREDVGTTWGSPHAQSTLTFDLELFQPDGEMRCRSEENLPYPILGPQVSYSVV